MLKTSKLPWRERRRHGRLMHSRSIRWGHTGGDHVPSAPREQLDSSVRSDERGRHRYIQGCMRIMPGQFTYPGVTMLKGTGVKAFDPEGVLAPGVLNSRDEAENMGCVSMAC